MKLLLVAVQIVYAFGCPPLDYPTCGDMEMVCPGGLDPAGCPMPDSCVPREIEMPDGHKCMGVCPVNCPSDMMFCPGSADERGCPMPDECHYKNVGMDRNACPE